MKEIKYNYYSIDGKFINERIFTAKSKDEYALFWDFQERNPERIEIINERDLPERDAREHTLIQLNELFN